MRIEGVAISNVSPLVAKLREIARRLVEAGTLPATIERINSALAVLEQEGIIDLGELIAFVECAYDQAVDPTAYNDGLRLHHAIQLAFGRKITPLFPFILQFHRDQQAATTRLAAILDTPYGSSFTKGAVRRRGRRVVETASTHQLGDFRPVSLCRFLLERIPALEEGREMLERFRPALVIRDEVVFSRFLRGLRRLVALRDALTGFLDGGRLES